MLLKVKHLELLDKTPVLNIKPCSSRIIQELIAKLFKLSYLYDYFTNKLITNSSILVLQQVLN
jgi:hypothetical protein